ncbi:hypothetical protein Barb4_02261 [Bacteroidales bacterium Barb4]|nr:hypothetical protein Barb4_02261 [Bacteroidales bacterium Barb4]
MDKYSNAGKDARATGVPYPFGKRDHGVCLSLGTAGGFIEGCARFRQVWRGNGQL